MPYLAGCKYRHFVTHHQTFWENSHLFMRESAGARVVRALCAWYGRAMRARAKDRGRATASRPHLSVSARAPTGREDANVRGPGGGRSERGSEERADRTESTQASGGTATASRAHEREGRSDRASRPSESRGRGTGRPPAPGGGTPPPGTTKNAPAGHHKGTFTVQWAEIPLPYYLTAERPRGAGRRLYKRKRQQVYKRKWCRACAYRTVHACIYKWKGGQGKGAGAQRAKEPRPEGASQEHAGAAGTNEPDQSETREPSARGSRGNKRAGERTATRPARAPPQSAGRAREAKKPGESRTQAEHTQASD